MTYRLTDSVAYLLNRAGTRSAELFARRLVPYGITVSMHRVLVALHDQHDQSLSDLSAMTSIEISTLSRMVSTMMRHDLVSRERLGSDGRTVTISLTGAGQTLAKQVIPLAIHQEQIGLRSLDPEVVEQLKRSLIAFYENLDTLEDELRSGQPVT
ncbi:MarR family winged helix-turn-helix transcriptional regulator [Lichenicoccus sp.]|uniref:MarR family winged helix-turn-helix transcriptional regulator n=1 Tax=Lichenicoccus sp. TaxID=2781899 RepID=UPI003D10CA7B